MLLHKLIKGKIMATVTFKNDITCNLAGTEVNVGDTAPVVTVTNCNPMLQDETVGGEGKVQLVIAVPSLILVYVMLKQEDLTKRLPALKV